MRGSWETAGNGIGRARRRLGRVLAARAVHLVELLGLRVVGLHLVVGDRPGRRDAVVVLELAEVLLAQAVERRAVELGRAADEVVDLRLERLALGVVPGVRRDVAVVDEDVLRRASSAARAAASRRARAAGSACPTAPSRCDQRAAAGAAADDDHVVVAHRDPISSRRSARMIRAGGLDQGEVREGLREVAQVAAGARRRTPRRRGPSGEATRSSRSIRSRARCCSPMIASAETSQNEQIRKLPSLPDRPSSVSSGPVAQHEAVLGEVVGDRQHASLRSRSSSPGRKPKSAASRVEASSASVS